MKNLSAALLALLTLLLSAHHGTAAKVKGLCLVGSKRNIVRTFIGVFPRISMQMPCSYKLVNMRCGGPQTEVWAENEVAFGYLTGETLVNGLTVKVTTQNSGGGTTVQTLSLTTQQLQAYVAAGNFSSSPWQWSSSGVAVDPAQKIVGHYDPGADRGRGVVVVGGLNVSLSRFQGGRGRRIRTVRIVFKCKSHKLKFYQDYPEALCGTANTTQDDVDRVIGNLDLDLDPHHPKIAMQDDYLLWVKQRASGVQTKPLCQEASNIINSAQCSSKRDEVLYDCSYMLNERSDYGYCIRSRPYTYNYTVMQVYTTCVRLVCGVEDAASNETCALLQMIQAACGSGGHSSLYERANCTFTPVTSPQKRRRIVYRGNGVCRDPDRVPSRYYSGNKPTTGSIETFSKQYQLRTALPCRYKMANIRCGDYKTEIYADYTTDVKGHAFLDGVTIKALTKTANGQRLVQVNKLTNRMLEQYIATGNFSQTPWDWSYRRDTEPSPAERVIGQFNPTSRAGVFVAGNLTVTYTYIDPRNASRGVADALRISCTDPNFRARQSYPETLCGSPKDTQPGNTAALDPPKTSDIHHRYTNFDALFLARQDARQSNPLCEETASIVSGGQCEQLGDALYECNYIRSRYTECLTSHDIDFFKVYVMCMHVMCGTTGPTSSSTSSATSSDTCNTLRDVGQACGYSEAHMDLSDLLHKAGCPPPANTTTTTTATTA